MAKVWRAAETTIEVVDAVATDTSKTLKEVVEEGTNFDFSSQCKNVTVTEPEGAIEKVDLLGVTSSFQNAELDFKPYGMATISGTILHERGYVENSLLEEWIEAGTDYDGGGTKVYQPGKGTYGDGRTGASILVAMADATYACNILLGDDDHPAYFTKLGDRTISGADSHWEQDFEAVCLPAGFYVEYKDE